jgi:hypothetical protein
MDRSKTKMNRREYLKRMGAGAGTLAAVSGLDVFASEPGTSANPQRKPKSTNIHPALNWPVTHIPPSPAPFVTAIFGGLMGFFYNTPLKACKVGFHPGHGHHLEVSIFQNHPACTPYEPVPAIPSHIKTMTLKVARQSSGPDFFETADPFNRETGNRQDFRWLPDLDGKDFYPRGHGKNRGHYNSWLHVLDGRFYTHTVSESTFKLVDVDTGSDIDAFGHVARIMAAALDVTEDVSLQINGRRPIILKYAPGVTYQIVFSNECSENGNPCHWEDHPSDETKRNDFHFARKVLKLPRDERRIGLRVVKPVDGPTPQFCRGKNKIESNDAAPCMGSGYGQNGV